MKVVRRSKSFQCPMETRGTGAETSRVPNSSRIYVRMSWLPFIINNLRSKRVRASVPCIIHGVKSYISCMGHCIVGVAVQVFQKADGYPVRGRHLNIWVRNDSLD
jgi:hypothetical protein